MESGRMTGTSGCRDTQDEIDVDALFDTSNTRVINIQDFVHFSITPIFTIAVSTSSSTSSVTENQCLKVLKYIQLFSPSLMLEDLLLAKFTCPGTIKNDALWLDAAPIKKAKQRDNLDTNTFEWMNTAIERGRAGRMLSQDTFMEFSGLAYHTLARRKLISQNFSNTTNKAFNAEKRKIYDSDHLTVDTTASGEPGVPSGSKIIGELDNIRDTTIQSSSTPNQRNTRNVEKADWVMTQDQVWQASDLG